MAIGDKVNFWEPMEQDLSQAGWPSYHPTSHVIWSKWKQLPVFWEGSHRSRIYRVSWWDCARMKPACRCLPLVYCDPVVRWGSPARLWLPRPSSCWQTVPDASRSLALWTEIKQSADSHFYSAACIHVTALVINKTIVVYPRDSPGHQQNNRCVSTWQSWSSTKQSLCIHVTALVINKKLLC